MFCLFHPFKLTPIISDPEYLLDQHILICVKSTDSDESYGNKRPCILVLCIWTCLRSTYNLPVSYSHRRGLHSTTSCPGVLHRVPDHIDSSWWEDRHIDRWHPATNLWGQAHWKVVWWVQDLTTFFLALVLVAPISYFALLSDFIKTETEKDDTGTTKGKGNDLNK